MLLKVRHSIGLNVRGKKKVQILMKLRNKLDLGRSDVRSITTRSTAVFRILSILKQKLP